MHENKRAVIALMDIAKSWGGAIEMAPDDEFDALEDLANIGRQGWSRPPDSGHVLNYNRKLIIFRDRDYNAGTIIHEMGHAFADKKSPEDSDEWEWFGWEICLAKKIGCYKTWSISSRHYIVGDFDPTSDSLRAWKLLTCRQKSFVAKNRIEHAISSGIVTSSGEPLSIR